MILKNKIKTFPNSPGVYQFIGSQNEILYIGRATSLKKRLTQYFRGDIDPRIAEMVSLAENIKIKKTPTLLEAIILEANLIKKHWPKYNVKDKDDRSFVYIVIPSGDYPAPLIIRGHELKKFPVGKNKVFGPYQSLALVKNALKIIRYFFPYGTCRPGQGKPCFERQIGLCPGACSGEISAKDYQKNIKNIILLLSGERKRLLNKLKKENSDKAQALEHVRDVSLITRDEAGITHEANRIESYDITHFAGKETYGAMAVFSEGRPDKKEYRLFKIKTAPAGDDLRALSEMLTRRFNHSEWPAPDLILIDGGKPQVDFVFKKLKILNSNISLVGLSKFGGDKLVFSPGAPKSFKDLAASIKNVLLGARDEAHRFGNRARRGRMRIK